MRARPLPALPRPLPVALLAAMVALALAAAGCGDDGGDETVTVTEGATEETATAPTETGAATVATDATAPPQGDHGPRHFQTPSGNIGCYLRADGVRCDIAERTWKPTPPEEPCELDYGQGISLDAEKAAFVCAGDTTLGGPATLGYGQSAQRGAFLCESERDGMTCSDVGDGHGFFISRGSFRIF